MVSSAQQMACRTRRNRGWSFHLSISQSCVFIFSPEVSLPNLMSFCHATPHFQVKQCLKLNNYVDATVTTTNRIYYKTTYNSDFISSYPIYKCCLSPFSNNYRLPNITHSDKCVPCLSQNRKFVIEYPCIMVSPMNQEKCYVKVLLMTSPSLGITFLCYYIFY